MRRRLFTALSAISLALCLAAVGLAARSYYVHDTITFRTPPKNGTMRFVEVLSAGGGLYAEITRKSIVPADARGAGWVWHIETGFGTYPEGITHDKRELPSGYQTHWWHLHTHFTWETTAWTTRPDADLRHHLETTMRSFGTPYWALVIAFAALPTIWSWRRYRRSRRHTPGTCDRCGYDLRASPERCPECGQLSGAAQARTK